MAKMEVVVGGVTGLLMVRIVLGSVMTSWKTTRERPRLEGFEMSLFRKDLKRLGQRHIEGILNPSSLGLSLVIFHLAMTLPSTVHTINKLVIPPTIASVFATKYRICLTTKLSSHQA